MATAAHDTSLELYQRTQTAADIRAQVNLIQEVMRAVMKEGTHYGTIPGCAKPSLWKPGAEVLFATFRVSVDPIVEDLSTREEARFRVTARATSHHGVSLGSAVGEASSGEEKYKWREVVCLEEWDATPEDRRRLKWKRGNRENYSIQQVLTNIADCRNTVLKMAAKRATVALALQVTAASDIFTQDIEDIPEEARADEQAAAPGPVPAPLPTEIKKKPASAPLTPQSVAPSSSHSSGAASTMTTAPAVPQRAAAPARTPSPAPPAERSRPMQPAKNVRVITDPQARRFYAIRKEAGWSDQETKAYLLETFGTEDDHQIPANRYEEACRWARSF